MVLRLLRPSTFLRELLQRSSVWISVILQRLSTLLIQIKSRVSVFIVLIFFSTPISSLNFLLQRRLRVWILVTFLRPSIFYNQLQLRLSVCIVQILPRKSMFLSLLQLKSSLSMDFIPQKRSISFSQFVLIRIELRFLNSLLSISLKKRVIAQFLAWIIFIFPILSWFYFLYFNYFFYSSFTYPSFM